MTEGRSEGGKMKIAAVGDIHVRDREGGLCRALFQQMASSADVIVLAGDLTNRGLPEEAEVLAAETHGLTVPVLAVLGNHDYECDHVDEVKKILCDAGIHMLEDEPFEMDGVGFAGVKGFCGGFGTHMLAPWGEKMIKSFVQEGIEEAVRLESGLARLRTERKVAVLHYAPVSQTVEGEPLEIWPFLGSSRLADPLARYDVAVAFHGHAHNGAHEGRAGDVPVFNVAQAIMQRLNPEQPFLLYEV
jgi:Icc-related predicted phosphoesterase